MDRSDAIRLAKLAAAGAAVWWVAKKATGAATAAVESATATRQLPGVNGLGILTFLDRTGDWSTITGEGGLPLQLDDLGNIYERRGAVLVRHDLDVDGVRAALAWSGLAGNLDVNAIMHEASRYGGLNGFKLKKVLKKAKSVASKVAVHKIVAKAVLGKKGEKKLQGVVKKSTPYLMIAGAAAATILTAGAAAPTLIGAGAALAAQVGKDVAQKRAEDAAKSAARDQAAAQAQADADMIIAQAQADGAAQGQYDAGVGVPADQPTMPDAGQPEAYKAAYRAAYSKAYLAAGGQPAPVSMQAGAVADAARPADMPPNYFLPAPGQVVAAQPVQRAPMPYAQQPQPVYYQPQRYAPQQYAQPAVSYPDQYEDAPLSEAEVMDDADQGDAFADEAQVVDESAEQFQSDDGFAAEDDGELSGIDIPDAEDGEDFAEVLTDSYAEGRNYRGEDYVPSGIPAPTGVEPGAASYGKF